MKEIRLSLFMLVLFLLYIPGICLGQQTEEREKKVYKLDKVIVWDHPIKEEGLFVTPEVTIIDVDKFKKAGAVSNIQDLLSEVLGIDVLRSSVTPSPSESIYIRGMDQSRIQVFVDGKPARLWGGFGYFKIDWSTWPLDNVETIEIIRGSHSLLFPFAMGGAINIITKKGIKTDEMKPKVTAKAEYGSFGTEGYSGNLSGGLFSTVGYSFAGAHRKGDGYLRNNYYDTDKLSGRVSLYLPGNGILSAGLDYVDSKTGNPVINNPSRADFDPGYPIVTEDLDTFTHGPEGHAYPGGKNYWSKRVQETSILLEQPVGPGEIRTQLWKHKSSRDIYYLKADGTQSISEDTKEHIWGVTLDFLNFDLITDHAFSVGGYYNRMGTTTPMRVWDNKDWVEIWSGYVQDVWSITPRLTATYGARYYRFEVDAWEPDHVGPWYEFDYRRVDEKFCPKARLDYQFKPDLSLYAAASREMRMA